MTAMWWESMTFREPRTQEQRKIRQWQKRNGRFLTSLRSAFGNDILAFPAKQRQVSILF